VRDRDVDRDHPAIANVSGTAVRDRDASIGDFFPEPKAIRREAALNGWRH
jgi:hypothetical protein